MKVEWILSEQRAARTDTDAGTHQHQHVAPGNRVDHTWYDSASQVTTAVASELSTLHYMLWFLNTHTHTVDQTWYDSVTQTYSSCRVNQVLYMINQTTTSSAECKRDIRLHWLTGVDNMKHWFREYILVWFSLTKTKTKMVKNEKITNSLTRTKTKK